MEVLEISKNIDYCEDFKYAKDFWKYAVVKIMNGEKFVKYADNQNDVDIIIRDNKFTNNSGTIV